MQRMNESDPGELGMWSSKPHKRQGFSQFELPIGCWGTRFCWGGGSAGGALLLVFFLPLIELVVQRLQHDTQLGGGGDLVALMLVEHAQDVLLLDFLQRLRMQ